MEGGARGVSGEGELRAKSEEQSALPFALCSPRFALSSLLFYPPSALCFAAAARAVRRATFC
jgi:hypothetical protein